MSCHVSIIGLLHHIGINLHSYVDIMRSFMRYSNLLLVVFLLDNRRLFTVYFDGVLSAW